ncbi:MAG: trypsin-like peptidase domain-containing protein [Gammaproteobacteria bacterium]
MKTQMLRIFSIAAMVAAAACSAPVEQIFTPSPEKVQKWRTAAEQGDTDAQFFLAGAYWFGEGVAENKREAVRWYRKSAEKEDPDAQYALGYAYALGEGVAHDKHEAIRWYRKSADQENSEAQYILGYAYWAGDGVTKDKREALRWWRKAAEHGNADAQHNLGWAYAHGHAVVEDQREAVRWYREAAEQGFVTSQHNLGNAYWNGHGVAEDKHAAVRWYLKAAANGYAQAQYLLSLAYVSGTGIAVDKREAVRWLHKAAKQDIASAQYDLGYVYLRGVGATKDAYEAMRWWRKAAEQGHRFAQNNLGALYLYGEYIATDKREAYIWFSIASANGNEKADENLRNYDWHDSLSLADMRSAKETAAQRLAEINRRKAKVEQETAIAANIVIGAKPKSTSTAVRVFKAAWRSVVVVHNGASQGSGVIVRPNVVATNCHVVDTRGKIIVYKADNRRADTDSAFSATIRHADEDKDFCLLDVNGLWGVPVSVRKYDTLSIGEDVYGLGAPKGFDLSLSDGVISQLRESGGDRFIQTNVAISPGSSGGGLFDSNANLIGIMTSKITDEETEGIGFAIPADLVLGH